MLLALSPVVGAQGQPEIRVSPSPLVFTEGRDASITISLSERPINDVQVTINPQDLYFCVTRSCFDVLTNRTQVTIPADQWETGVTYRFGAESIETDPDTEDHTGTIRFSSNRYQEFNLSYTMLDDNRPYPEFEFSSSSSFVLSENDPSRIIGIGPGRTPDIPVRIYATSSDPGALSVEPSSHFFASRSIANFTVTPVQDSDIRDEDVTVTFELRQSNGQELPGGNTTAKALVTVDDDESMGFELPAETLDVNEGGGGRFRTRLSEAPSGDVRVQVTASGSSDISLNRTELTFTTGNWDEYQTVPFTIRHDGDSVSELQVINLQAIGGGYQGITGEVSVQIEDDEVPQVTGMPTAARVAEGGTLTVDTLKLAVRPARNVEVKLASSDPTRLTVSPATLTFTRGNWSIGQEIEFSTAVDGDLLDNEVRVDVTASGATGFEGVMGSFKVEVTDVSSHTISAVGSNLANMTEGSTAGSIAVRLNSQPSGDVEVRVGVPGYVGNDFTVCAPGLGCQEAMTFTSSNWDVAQLFRVLPNEDQDDQDFDGDLMITASGAEYTGAPAVPVSLQITDNDRPGLTLSTSSLTIDEGDSASFTVRLTNRPVTQVSVRATAGNGLASVSPEYVVFSPNNWNIPQTVYLTAAQDSNGYNENTSVTLSAEGNRTSESSANPYQSATGSVSVEVIDDDGAQPAIAVRLWRNRPWVEGGDVAVSVRLLSRPDTHRVKLTLTADDSSKFSSSATSADYYILRDQWETAEPTVNLTLAEDTDTTDDEVTFTITASGGNYEGISEIFKATIIDNDAKNVIIQPTDLFGEMQEGGSPAEYAVRLSSVPTGDVTVTVTSSDSGAVSVVPDPGSSSSTKTLTFTTSNWEDAQVVTVMPVQDADAEIERGTINASSTGGGYSDSSSAPFTVVDDDISMPVAPPTPTVPTIELSLRDNKPFIEGGQTTIRITALTEPDRNTVFAVQPQSNYDKVPDVDVAVTLSRAQWLAGTRYVDATVTALRDDDEIADDDIIFSVTGATSGSNYNNVSKNITLTIYDVTNPPPGFLIIPSNGTGEIMEGGRPIEYGVQLSRTILPFQGSDIVTVMVASSDTDAARVSPAQLTFTGRNWNTPQIVTVTPVHDRDAEDDRGTINLSVPADGGPVDFRGLTASAPFVIRDDEKVTGLDFTVEQKPGPVHEAHPSLGDGATFTIKLSARPSGDVTYTVTSTDTARLFRNSAGTVAQNNWRGQDIGLRAPRDADTVNNDVDFTVTLNGGGFNNYSKTFTVTLYDLDSNNIAVAPVTTDILYEGGSSREFVLCPPNFISTGTTVTINLASSDPGAATVSPSSLTMNNNNNCLANGAAGESIRVTPVDDDDARDEEVTINLSASGGNYNNVTGSFPVTVLDRQVPEPPEEEEEAEPLDFTFAHEGLLRNGQPTTIRLNTTAPPSDTVTFTFTTLAAQGFSTWTFSDPQTNQPIGSVQMQPSDYSADPAGGKEFGLTTSGTQELTSVEVVITANGGGFDNLSKRYRGLQVVGSSTNPDFIHYVDILQGPDVLSESGRAVRYEVIPILVGNDAFQPRVNVAITSNNSEAVKISPSSLSFASSEWGAPKSFTVTPIRDGDGDDENITLTATMTEQGGGAIPVHDTHDLTIKDDYTVAQTFTITSDAMREVDSTSVAGKIYVRLSERPSGTVTFTPSFEPTGKLSGSSSTFTVAANDWSSENEFSLNGALDTDTVDDDVNITLSASGGGYNALTKTHKVTVFDSAGYAFAVAPVDPLADFVEEGLPIQYSVRLTRAPDAGAGAAIVVNVTSDNPDVVVDTDPNTAGNQGSLSFSTTGSQWSQIRTISLTAINDADKNNDDATITFASAPENEGMYLNAQAVSTSLRVTDNDRTSSSRPVAGAGLTRIDNISGNEGARVSRSVRLNAQPRARVQLNLVSSNPDITFASDSAGASPITSLTFGGNDWDTDKTFYTVLGQDSDPIDETSTVSLVAIGGGYGGVTGSYSVTVNDDEPAASTFTDFVEFSSVNPLTLVEGKKQRVGVRLRYAPVSGVQFSNERSNSGNVGDYKYETEYSASGDASALLFTPENWNIYQYFSITPFIDLNATDDIKQLNLRLQDIRTVGGGGQGDIIESSTGSSLLEMGSEGLIAVTDTASASIVLAEDTISVVEGGVATYSVRLGAWDEIRGVDSKQVTVSGTSGDTTALSNSSNSLTFTSANWNIPQELQFDTVEDADSDDEQVAITFTVSGGGYSSVSTQATADVRDNDAPGLVLSGNALALDEGGLPKSVTVKLSSQPSDNVEVRLGSSDAGAIWADADPATTGTQNDVTFTSFNWQTPQPISIVAFDDADSIDESASITLTANGGGYDGVTASVGVTVEDDEVPGLSISPESIRMNEGAVANLDVRLSAIPNSDVTVTLTMPNDVQDSLLTDLTTLTFTPDRWNIGQSFTLTALRDADFRDELIELTLTNTGGGFTGTGASVRVRIDDDNPNVVLSLADQQTLQIPEGGSETFTVRLDKDPGANGVEYVFALSGDDGFDFDTDAQTPGDQGALNFTSANWSTPQTVTVFSTSDQNAVNETATLSISSDNDLTPVTVSLEAQDGNRPELSGVPVGVIGIDEGNSATVSNFRLIAEPLSEVVLSFVSSSSSALVVDANPNLAGNQSAMRFTQDNWNVPRSVVLSALDDSDAVDDEVTIVISASGGVFETLMGSFDVEIDDDESRGVNVTEASGSAATLEEGESGIKIYDVSLTTKPSGNVIVTGSFPHPDSVHHCRTTSPALSQCVDSLTFTPDNYSTAQQFVIGAREDDNGIDETGMLTFSVSGADYEGAAITSPSLSLTIDDNDTPGLTFTPAAGLRLDEGGPSKSFTVVLDTEPSSDVTVRVLTNNTRRGPRVTDEVPGTLHFTPSNWNIPQSVRIFTGINSNDDDAIGTIQLQASGGDYGGVTGELRLRIVNSGNPTRTYVTPPATTTRIEPYVYEPITSSSAGAVSANLSQRPTGPVTLTFAPKTTADGNKISITNATIELTEFDWDNSAAPRATVAVKANAISDHDEATLTVTASGGGYDGLTKDLTVPLTYTDGAPTILIRRANPSRDHLEYLEEGGSSMSIGISPSVTLSGNANVTMTTSNTALVKVHESGVSGPVDQATISWSSGWRPDQITWIVFTPQTDADTVDTQVDLMFTSASFLGSIALGTKTFPVLVKEVNVTTQNNPWLLLNASNINVNEGGTHTDAAARQRVSLVNSPTGNVRVTFSSSNPDVSVRDSSGAVLTHLDFTQTDWSVDQDYWVVIAEDDQDVEDEVATLVLSASGGGYAGVTADHVVNIRDNDTPSISFFPGSPNTPVVVDEGGKSRVFTMVLDQRPSSDVSFSLDPAAIYELSRFQISPSTVTFTTDNWNQPQTLSLTHQGDTNAFNSTAVDVPLKATGGGKFATVNSGIWTFKASSLNDSDRARLTVNPSVVSVYEGSSVDVHYALSHLCYSTLDQSNSDYTIAITDSKTGDDDDTAVAVTKWRADGTTPAGSFDSLNWNARQVLRITALEDTDSDHENITMRLAGSQVAPTLGCAGLEAEVTVKVIDNDASALPLLSKFEIDLEEGGKSGALTVVMSERPAGTTQVSVSSASEKIQIDANLSVTGRQGDLVFTPSDWNVPKTIKITPLQDDDTDDESINVSVTSANFSETVLVNIEDDDEAGMIVSATTLTIDENSTDTFEVRLNAPPASGNTSVTVVQPTLTSVTVDTNPSLAANQNRLTFTQDNWNLSQAVHVAVGDDSNAFEETTSIVLRAFGGGFEASASVDVVIENNDDLDFVIKPERPVISEGGSTDVMVALASKPSEDVAFTIETSTADLTASSTGSGTFTPSNWSTPQSVTLSLAQDDNAFGESADITFKVSGNAGEYTGVLTEFSVDFRDDDTAAVLTQQTGAVALREGGSGSFGIRLATRPGGDDSGDVIVTPSCNGCTQLSFSPTSLTFTESNWDTWASFTISAVQETGDTINNDFQLTFAASGRDYSGVDTTLPLTVVDDDAPGVVLSETLVVLAESSASGRSTGVKLSQQPTGDVLLTFDLGSISEVRLDTDQNTANDQNTLTFTTTNWDDEQDVLLIPVGDADASDESGSITVNASGGGFDTISSDLTFLVEDDETPSLICGPTACSEMQTQVEQAAGTVRSIRLGSEPENNVTVFLSSSNPDVTFVDDTVQQNPLTSLSFDATNWSVSQNFKTAIAADRDGSNETAVITLTAGSDRASGAYNNVSESYTLNITDAQAVDIDISLSSGDAANNRLIVQEGGTASFDVTLDLIPTDPVTVALSSADIAKGYALSPVSLTFNAADYQRSKRFNISPPSDRDTLDEDVSVTLVMSGGEYTGKTKTLYLSVDDDETPELLITPSELSVAEGLTQTFTVQLAAEPRNRPTSQGNTGNSSLYDVNVAVVSGDSGAVRVLTPSISFSASEWNVPKTVSLSAVEDSNQFSETPSITLTASAAACAGCALPDYNGVTKIIAVSTLDNDIPNLHLSDLLLNINEAGVDNRFTVNLLNRPNADVNVTVTSADTGAVTVFPAALTFTTQNWNQPRTVIVRPVADQDGEDEAVTVTVSGTGGGYLNTTNSLTVNVKDEDPALLQLNKNRLLLAEGNRATFAVSLSAAPISEMTVALTSQDVGAVSVTPDVLTFSPGDWNTRARIVTVIGETDPDAVDESVTVDLNATGGGYTDVSIQVDVEVVDTGSAELSLPSRIQIVESTEATFDVRLLSEPGSLVTLRLTQPGNPDITLDANEFAPGDQTEMTFGAGNWDDPQTVKLIARDDGDAQDEPTSIMVTASGGDYDGLSATIDVSLIDDDRVRLLLVPNKSLGVTEGDSAGGALSVRLGSLPAGTVTVTPEISSDDASKLTISPMQLTFDASNWQTTRDFTLTPEDDTDPADERIVINLTTEGGGYENRSEEFIVDIEDDDAAELVIEAPPQPYPDQDVENRCPADDVYCLKESDVNGLAIRLKLSAQPSEDVTVEISSNNTDSIRATSQTLTFSPTNWDTAQSATVQAIEDSNAYDEDVDIKFSASGGGYDGVAETVKAKALDTDRHGLVLSESQVEVPEGGSKAFNVRLSAQPRNPAVVTVAQPSNPDILIDTDPEEDGVQNTLLFSPDDWNVDQEVTIFAASDEDANTESDDTTLTLQGSDFPSTGITHSLNITIREDEQLGLLVTGAPLTVHEGDAEGEKIQVRLLSKPTVDVTVSVNNTQTALMLVQPGSLTFTPDNWDADQSLTVTGVEDNDDTRDHPSLTFKLVPQGGEYSSNTLEQDVEVTVIDNDQIDNADLVLSTNMLTILEGESLEFHVKLAVVPESDVTVQVISMDTLAASVSPPKLKFTQQNWDIDQKVTVTGVQDLFDMEDVETKIVFSTTGGGYSGAGADKEVSVMIIDAEGIEADVVKQVLAETGRSALIGTQEVIGRRLDAAPGLRTATVAGREISLSRQASRDLASGFAGIAGAQDLGAERFDGFWFGHERRSMDWLGGIELRDGKPLQKAPELSTLGRSMPLLGNFTYDLSADRGVGWTIWGRLDQREFSGELEATLPGETQGQSYENSQSSVWLGFDRRLVSGAVIGVAVSQSTGEGSYTVQDAMLEMETNVTNYLSYFELGLGTEGRLRIMLGSGTGDMTVTPSTGPISTVNLTTVLGSFGFRWPLARVGQGRLVLTGSLGLSEVSTDEASSQCSLNSCVRIDSQGLNHGAAISEIDAANNSARIGLQLEPRPWTFGTDWNLEPRIGLSLRQDSGDGIEGSGAELTSALKLKTPSERFSVDLGMQYLGTHSAAELSEEWGASLEFALHSIDDSGRGLSLSVGPQWGLRDTGLLERAEAFAVNDAASRRGASPARRQAASLGAQLGYGLDALGGMLTPFAEYNFTGGTYASSRQNLGVRFNTTDDLEAKLFSEQQSVRGGTNTSGFGFEIRKIY